LWVAAARLASSARICRVASKPSIMGMLMSMRMTRGRREGSGWRVGRLKVECDDEAKRSA
jgi:hypothetical protein